MAEGKPKSQSGVWTTVKPFVNGGASGMLATCVIQPVDMVKYADRPLPGGTAKNQPSAIDFGRRRSTEGESDHRRSIEGEKVKKKKKRKRRKKKRRRRTYFPRDVLARAPSPPVGRPRTVAALAHERFFSRTRRWNISPRGEKDRGDFASVTDCQLVYLDKLLIQLHDWVPLVTFSFFRVLTNKAVEANDGKPLPLLQKAAIGLTAGAIGACIGSPADLALIRMQADATLPAAQRRNYKNAFHALYRIVADEGVLALWKGAGPTVVRAMSLNMGMLASYDQSVELFRDSLGFGEVSTVLGKIL
ncbi:hypothetical protein BHE74_00036255 [Ensete ventricosum]|nr:hypothetical protein BHE74_00036255 [Ensete ventricosum]RZS12743.1 hypothetical protein BHM03_00044232 [Ensete ventricosum]